MRIGKLHFKNFRGFENFELDLSENRLAVFVGENGSGKSSLLDGVRYLFMKFFNKRAPFKAKDIRYDLPFHSLFSSLSLYVNDIKKEVVISGKEQSAESLLDYLNEAISVNKNINIPIFSFYSSLRDFSEKEVDENTYNLLEEQLKAYYRSVTSKALRYDLFYNWFKEEEDAENEIRLNNDNTYRNRKLDSVRSAISSFIPYKSPITGLRFKGRPNAKLTIEFEDNELTFDQLSDGEKSILVLVGDIARRLAIANPSLENPIEGEGVVMIDEIDSHLHPKWQEEIVPALLRTFPNIQFLITTHSPHVVRNVPSDSVYVLKDFKIEEGTSHTYALNIEDVLSGIFETKSKHPFMEKAISEMAALIEEENIDAAKRKIEALSEIFGDEYPEIFKMRNAINFWE